MQITCLQHVPYEGPAAIAHWAAVRGHSLTAVKLYAGETLPDQPEYDMLVVMGGPMNIYGETKYPWLAEEKEAIRDSIAAGKVVFGVCLGAQLIADALGAKITQAEEPEIGWYPIHRSPDCPDSLTLPDSLQVYHWHGDTFAQPEGAIRIASSVGCRNQGFLYHDRVLGLQCHLETTRESMNALIEASKDETTSGKYVQNASAMRAEPQSTFDNMQAVLFKLLDQISSHVRT